MFRNEITINTISLRSNSSERLGRCGGRGRGEEKKERKKKKTFDCAAYVHKGITRKRKRKNNLGEQ